MSEGKSKVCGSGEKTEGRAARIPMLSPSPTPQMPSFLGGHSPPVGICVGESNNPTLQRLHPAEESAAWVGVQRSGQTKGVSVTELCGFAVEAVPSTFP